jgi:hypothetical protein
MGIRLLGTVLLVACSAIAQSPSTGTQGGKPPTQQEELKKLAASAALLHTDLPGFACTETAMSQAIKENKRNPQKNKVTAQVQFVAEVRAERGEDGRLDESLTLNQVDGKLASGGRFDPPIMVDGGFDQSLDFFLPERQSCFNFTLSNSRIDFVSPPGTFDRKQCGEMGAPHGVALFDAAGNVTHVERQVPAENAQQAHLVNFTAIDFVPTELGGTVYALPAKMVSEVQKNGETLHFEATYSGCHLFKAISTILPGSAPEPESSPAPSHP